MRINSLWNRIFHSSEIKENGEQYKVLFIQVKEGSSILEDIKSAGDLTILFALHKRAWKAGFNKNIGPCEWGYFRTGDILTMKPSEVFLGGIYGLNTHDLHFWERNKDEYYGTNGFNINPDIKVYDLILTQYRNILLYNIQSQLDEASVKVPEYYAAGYRLFHCFYLINGFPEWLHTGSIPVPGSTSLTYSE